MTEVGKENSKDIEALIKNMEAFNEVTEQLQRSYDELQVRVKQLDLELRVKTQSWKKTLLKKRKLKII
jgi:hypothetical protein